MPEIKELIPQSKLQELMRLLEINSLEELKKWITQINDFNKDKFMEKMGLAGKDCQNIFTDQELEELCKDKNIWIESIDTEIESQQKKPQDATVLITPDGPCIMQVCGEDQKKTIQDITEAYQDITKTRPEYKKYESEKEFLDDPKNKNLPEKIKQELCKNGFPLIVHILKFESKREFDEFKQKITPLLNTGKLICLDDKPASSLPSTPTPTNFTSFRP